MGSSVLDAAIASTEGHESHAKVVAIAGLNGARSNYRKLAFLRSNADLKQGMRMTNSEPDYTEVSRAAHELSQRHGREAHLYAERYAQQASREGGSEEHDFWRAVVKSLRPRSAE